MKKWDLVLWGVTGFTGRLCAEYLAEKYGEPQSLRWAVGARNPDKARRILADIGRPDIAVIQADSADLDSLRAMAAQTRAICSVVGPYARYGTPLVEACIAEKTHYCDLTGEVGWMRNTIDRFDDAARQAGVKIVHTCGFDSIPSDLGVHFFQKKALETTGSYAAAISLKVSGAKGGFSGGTWASMSAQIERAQSDRNFARLLANPYALNPDPAFRGPDGPDLRTVRYDPLVGQWIAPFIMAGINTRVVRRSAALLQFAYGPDFRYDEAMCAGSGLGGRLRAWMILLMLGAVASARPGSIAKSVLDRLAPKPGEGPSRKLIESGYFNMRLIGSTPAGQKLEARVSGKRDPGYGATSRMLAECGVCLARDTASLPERCGVLTPATAMGDVLIARLETNADICFDWLGSVS